MKSEVFQEILSRKALSRNEITILTVIGLGLPYPNIINDFLLTFFNSGCPFHSSMFLSEEAPDWEVSYLLFSINKYYKEENIGC